MIISILIILCIATTTDIKKHQVPLWLTPVGITIQTLFYAVECWLNAICIQDVVIAIVCGTIIFFIMHICMRFGNLGGADTVLGFLIGYNLGLYEFYSILFSFIFVLPYAIYMKATDSEHEYPFVPYILAGYLFTLAMLNITEKPLIWLL